MSKMINMMKELGVCDKTIISTMTKVNTICSEFEHRPSSNTFAMSGNGNGNN